MSVLSTTSVTASLNPAPIRGKNGYFSVSVGRGTPGSTSNGRRYLHRYVMALHLGRELEPGEVVHHVHGTPELNDPQDLWLFGSQSDHLRWHALERSGRLLEKPMLPLPVPTRPLT